MTVALELSAAIGGFCVAEVGGASELIGTARDEVLVTEREGGEEMMMVGDRGGREEKFNSSSESTVLSESVAGSIK